MQYDQGSNLLSVMHAAVFNIERVVVELRSDSSAKHLSQMNFVIVFGLVFYLKFYILLLVYITDDWLSNIDSLS